ncbi:MAG: DUF4388 domain-containing protein [Thermaceae bacterium]
MEREEHATRSGLEPGQALAKGFGALLHGGRLYVVQKGRVLKGDLADFPLAELLSALMRAGRSGLLRIAPSLAEEGAPSRSGEVYLNRGQVVHAEVRIGDRVWEGEEALLLLSGVPQASFHFEAGVAPPRTTLPGGLSTPLRVAEAVEVFRSLEHLPKDWSLVLRLPERTGEVHLSLEELRLLGEAEGKRVAELLLSEKDPLRAAKLLDQLLGKGVLQAVPEVRLSPVELLVLPIYGPGEGVAFVDEALYGEWARRIKQAFRLRLLAWEVVLEARPRPTLLGRLGLLEKDLVRLRLRRGDKVQVVPEV